MHPGKQGPHTRTPCDKAKNPRTNNAEHPNKKYARQVQRAPPRPSASCAGEAATSRSRACSVWRAAIANESTACARVLAHPCFWQRQARTRKCSYAYHTMRVCARGRSRPWTPAHGAHTPVPMDDMAVKLRVAHALRHAIATSGLTRCLPADAACAALRGAWRRGPARRRSGARSEEARAGASLSTNQAIEIRHCSTACRSAETTRDWALACVRPRPRQKTTLRCLTRFVCFVFASALHG